MTYTTNTNVQDNLYDREVVGIFTFEMVGSPDYEIKTTGEPHNSKKHNEDRSIEYARQYLTPPPPHRSPRNANASPLQLQNLPIQHL